MGRQLKNNDHNGQNSRGSNLFTRNSYTKQLNRTGNNTGKTTKNRQFPGVNNNSNDNTFLDYSNKAREQT